MNVSIITLHEANNVGAFLQAYSLQEVLKSIPEIENVSFVVFPRQGKANSKIKKAIGYLKQRQIKKVIFKYKSSKKYAAVARYLNIDNTTFSSQSEYDYVVVGSDEIWNVKAKSFTHYPQYFGKEINATKIISYAASGNSTKPIDVVQANMDFNSFDYISVRDMNTFELVESIDGREPILVCDPTILIGSFERVIVPIERKGYILVYSYNLGKKEINEVKEFSRLAGKKLISVGTYNSWCDENIVVTPFEFLSWLKSAEYVITSTFHGCVLSAKLQKEFAVYTHSKDQPVNHKINDFLERTKLKKRDAATYELSDIFNEKIDYCVTDEAIQEQRMKSKLFLKEVFNSND